LTRPLRWCILGSEMAFIPVPSTIQINLKGNSGGSSTWEMVHYVDGIASGSMSQTLADGIAAVFATARSSSGLTGLLWTGWSLTSAVFTELSTQTGLQFTSAVANGVGTSSADPLPAQNAALINWHTALRGRSYRGRTFVPGFTETDSGGGLTSTLVTALTSYAGDLISGINSYLAGSGDLVVVSRFSGTHLESGPGGQLLRRPTPRVTGLSTPITIATVDNAWKTQRRRAFV
jgi:hypothetical protein